MKQCLLLVNYLDHISRQIEKHNGRKRGKKTGEGRSNDYEKNMVKISRVDMPKEIGISVLDTEGKYKNPIIQ